MSYHFSMQNVGAQAAQRKLKQRDELWIDISWFFFLPLSLFRLSQGLSYGTVGHV